MGTMTTLQHRRGGWTRADLDEIPDDGCRYELIDGVLVVSPGPRPAHQGVAGNLHLLLRAGCPRDLRVLFAPFDVSLAEDTVMQPDLLVAPRSQFTDRELVGAPLLVIEVASPSTRRVDRSLKRDRFEEAGIASYWLVDPAEPSVTVLELVDGRYVEVARVVGDEVASVTRPFAVQLQPTALLDD